MADSRVVRGRGAPRHGYTETEQSQSNAMVDGVPLGGPNRTGGRSALVLGGRGQEEDQGLYLKTQIKPK